MVLKFIGIYPPLKRLYTEKNEMTSLYSSEKRTRVHNQGEFSEQKDFFDSLATLEPVSFGIMFSYKDICNSIQKKKLDRIRGKYSYPRPGSKST